jgi:putative SOS response-associated peptidase YedK
MCNRYEQRGSASQIKKLAKALGLEIVTTAATDNLGPQDNVYPDQDAPIVRRKDKGLELAKLRWGFPGVEPKETLQNIRNPGTPWWKRNHGEYLLKPEYRCLVPFTAFAEPVRDSTWFVVPGNEVAYFAGVWRPWHGERLAEVPGKARRQRTEGDYELFAFFTTDANDIVRPVHERAMPVILIDPKEQAEWMSGGEVSLRLQRPLPNSLLSVRPKESQ